MAVQVLGLIELQDPSAFEEYRKQVGATVEQYGGQITQRGVRGDVFWNEGEAGDYVNELFTDSAARYLSESVSGEVGENEPLTLPVTDNLVVMITIAFEGESAALETSLADREALEDGLKSIINLHYQGRLRAIQVHFSPAQLGDELTNEQLLLNFPELLPL